jgi:Ca-activated chloride channel family protein
MDPEVAGLATLMGKKRSSLEDRYRGSILERDHRPSRDPSTIDPRFMYRPYQPPLEVALPTGSLLEGLFSVDVSDSKVPAAMRPDEVWVVTRSAITSPVLASPALASPTLPASLTGHSRQGKRDVILPLRGTTVKAQILGFSATVSVDQRFHNPAKRKIDISYTFPLPHDAAVSDFLVSIDGRTIRGFIRERTAAERLYREARDAGYVASLITQRRPDAFRQTVSNVDPGKRVDVRLVYFQRLAYRDGGYNFVFPALHTKAPLTIDVDIDAGVGIEAVSSSSHTIDVRTLARTRRSIRVRGKKVSARDFALRYKVAGKRTKSVAVLQQDRSGSYFSLILQPPASLQGLGRTPLEMIFVIDLSQSMRGLALRRTKRLVRRALRGLRAGDTFQIVGLGARSSGLGTRMVPATSANIARGLVYLGRLRAGGKHSKARGLARALRFPHDARRTRVVSLLSDGYLGNHAAVVRTVRHGLGSARVMAVGIGSSINRRLLEDVARVGRGAAAFVGLSDRTADARLDSFFRRIAYPALTEISVSAPGARLRGVYPRKIPDLLVGRPVSVVGRISGKIPKAVELRGRVAGREVRVSVPVTVRKSNDTALAKLWARAKVADLVARASRSGLRASLRSEIRRLARKHGILSSLTAFIAVDAASRSGAGKALPVAIPERMPTDVPRLP